jgi:predicted TPR repeat methyltransferase
VIPDAKFYFRRGTMHQAVDDIEAAFQDLKEAHRLQPNDAVIAKKLKDIKR